MDRLKEIISPNNINVPPHNIEAEKAILGGILINNDAINQTMDILSPDDFYKESHSHLFEGMIMLYNENEPIDLITVTQILATKNTLDKSGGNDYIISLIEYFFFFLFKLFLSNDYKILIFIFSAKSIKVFPGIFWCEHSSVMVGKLTGKLAFPGTFRSGDGNTSDHPSDNDFNFFRHSI